MSHTGIEGDGYACQENNQYENWEILEAMCQNIDRIGTHHLMLIDTGLLIKPCSLSGTLTNKCPTPSLKPKKV